MKQGMIVVHNHDRVLNYYILMITNDDYYW